MSESVQPTPAPVAPSVVIPDPSSERMREYLQKFQDKQVRMRQSWVRSAIWLTALVALFIGAVSAIGELSPWFKLGHKFIFDLAAKNNIPLFIPTILAITIPAVIWIQIIQAIPAVLVWWERKVAAHIQGRLGPMDVGGWHGWAQTIADGIKLLLKEIIEPLGSDKWVFRLAPVIVFVPAYLCVAPLPLGNGLAALDLDIGLIYVMAVSGLSTIGVLMAGWGSNNKFSIFGGLRAAAQVVSFEIPRILSVVPVIMWVGSMNLTHIMNAQSLHMGGWFPRWFIFYPVVGQISFIIYLITTIAETNRVPFDVPEAESELTAGFHTEYGGMKFAIFFLAEYAYVFIGSLLGAVLFLGGGSPLFPALDFIPSWAWMLMKTFGLIFIFLWSRWTFPRIRVDRIMDLCWKIFIPWTLINILITGFVLLWRLK
ncbi:MAG: NADH-quinone oxidoreductase subunit NuoH [Elusimicrobiota bacterium]